MTPTENRMTQKGSFINNANQTGVDLLLTDITTSTTNEIVTTINFVSGMYAEVALADSPYIKAQVTANGLGKAVIDLTEDYAVGSKVEYRLYRSSTAEKVALSKALKKKPGADL